MYVDERSNIESTIVPALKLHMEIGWTKPVEYLLDYYSTRVREICSAETVSKFEEAEAWLKNAKEHERIHGENSLMNTSHPVYERVNRRLIDNPDHRLRAHVSKLALGRRSS
ncbi:hypothetical protein ACVINZ_006723 [Mesorhizobium jarvisii]